MNVIEDGKLADLILLADQKLASPRMEVAHEFFNYSKKERKLPSIPWSIPFTLMG